TTEEGEQVIEGNPLYVVRDYMKQHRVENYPKEIPFSGGAMGYISYDYMHYIEEIPCQAVDDLQIPDVAFLFFDDICVYDHKEKKLWFITHYEEDINAAKEQIEVMKEMWCAQREVCTYDWEVYEGEGDTSFTLSTFHDAVEKTKEYIAAGDVFQVNLSVRQSQPLNVHPIEIYKQLRQVNPSPYM